MGREDIQCCHQVSKVTKKKMKQYRSVLLFKKIAKGKIKFSNIELN